MDWPYETWEEAAMDLGVSVDALKKETLNPCPRTGKWALNKDGSLIDCEQCGECGELPF